MAERGPTEISKSFFIASQYRSALGKLGLTSIDAVFSFAAEDMNKKNLAAFRSRMKFDIAAPGSSQPTTVFLKRYNRPPAAHQLANWLAARARKSCGALEYAVTTELSAAGIGTPRPVRSPTWRATLARGELEFSLMSSIQTGSLPASTLPGSPTPEVKAVMSLKRRKGSCKAGVRRCQTGAENSSPGEFSSKL